MWQFLIEIMFLPIVHIYIYISFVGSVCTGPSCALQYISYTSDAIDEILCYESGAVLNVLRTYVCCFRGKILWNKCVHTQNLSWVGCKHLPIHPVFHVSTDACMWTFHIKKSKKTFFLNYGTKHVFTTLDVHYQSTYSIFKSSVIVGVEFKHILLFVPNV